MLLPALDELPIDEDIADPDPIADPPIPDADDEPSFMPEVDPVPEPIPGFALDPVADPLSMPVDDEPDAPGDVPAAGAGWPFTCAVIAGHTWVRCSGDMA